MVGGDWGLLLVVLEDFRQSEEMEEEGFTFAVTPLDTDLLSGLSVLLP